MQQPGLKFNKTRIAPTPSGYLHLGNVLSFVLTAGLARQSGAKILLRIDDLDRDRVKPEYIQDIFDTLNFLEIPWDEGPRNAEEYRKEWSQMHRLELYQDALKKLEQGGHLFACTCSRAQLQQYGNVYPGTCLHKNLPLNTPDSNLRLITDGSEIVVNTLSGKQIAMLPAEMNYFVVRKKDGLPAYQLASVVDDIYFGVDLVVRGLDLWPSTLAQLQLAAKLGNNAFADSTFFHHPLLMAPDGQKLSKSAGDTSIKYLREQGKSPADIYTIIANLFGKTQRVNNWSQFSELLPTSDV
ncbi:glutamate--tRNA ligase family protein [uncultured Mucilaginibacter sp.]|uniref:glutamate--tRNA ligase family protein n=1 Tax=uncultured Mucilaginibacter sp. TaxID=797541 RepID=UPI0025D4930E|nr:glutamate--tRNA ligase family protein [uncultured Mucilaginibacter sp.]